MINLRHEHPADLDTDQRRLAVHLIGDHDMQDGDLPGELLRSSLEDLQAIHRRDHDGLSPVRGLFQWINVGHLDPPGQGTSFT